MMCKDGHLLRHRLYLSLKYTEGWLYEPIFVSVLESEGHIPTLCNILQPSRHTEEL